MRQASSEKHANISAIYTAESLDAFPDSRSKASTLLEMSDGALVAGGLYSDPATDRYLLMKICGSYFPKIYSGLFRLQAESGVDGDKSQLSAIHDELLDDIDDLSSALRALSVNFEIGDMIKSSSEKIFRSGKELADSMFSYDEFNPDEISKRMVSFETLCVQMWVYCSGLLADMLAGALAGARDSLVYFCAEYALFLIFLSSAVLAVAFGIRRSARRTATLARACLSGSPEEARVRYYSAAPFFGREFGEIDALILEAAAARSRLLELSKKLSVACISGRNENRGGLGVKLQNVGLCGFVAGGARKVSVGFRALRGSVEGRRQNFRSSFGARRKPAEKRRYRRRICQNHFRTVGGGARVGRFDRLRARIGRLNRQACGGDRFDSGQSQPFEP